MDRLVTEILKRRDVTILCPPGHAGEISSQVQNKIYEVTHLPLTSSVYSQIKERRYGDEEGCVEDVLSFILNRKEGCIGSLITKLEHVYVVCPEEVVFELITRQISGNNILVKMVKQ